MKVHESPPDAERLRLLNAVAEDAATLLGVDLHSDTPQSIIAKVNDSIVDLVFDRETPAADDENPDLLLGALWGAQLERQFGWYWADVVIDDQFNEVAMISPKQEMIIFPLAFTGAIIAKQCICTVALSFNMLLENDQTGTIPPRSYENIMLQIHHIVPPYTLEEDA